MNNTDQYGAYRCLEPKHSFPDSAWKLDNTMKIYDGEIIVEVSLLNIDANSFKQIYVECDGDKERISKKVLEIVDIRGKLHNPITGTGGILYGRVVEISPTYPNKEKIKVGDNIISLTSLALTPLKIDSIINIDSTSGQLEVRGKAILFPNSPLIKAPSDLPLKLLMAVLDEAGAAINSFKLSEESKSILIIGASGELGLMCAYAARKKIGSTGKIVGLRSSNGDRNFKEELSHIYDDVLFLDVFKPMEAYASISMLQQEFDMTINCVNSPGAEMLSILCTRSGGSVYLASLSCNYKNLCLSAEGVAKDLNIIGYKGYTEGHAKFTMDLLKENPQLAELLVKRLDKNYNKASISNKLELGRDLDKNVLKAASIEEYVFASAEMHKVLDNALKVANYDCNVLITGESGTGKEIIATLIHKNSERSTSPSIKINCGSIPKDLLEAELFGYEKGAFTGADKNGKLGFFEIADSGTLFLDEIGELPLELQVKLLRAIQEKEIYRVGGTVPVRIDVRIIAATNKNLYNLMQQGAFREDLFYRLNVFPIEIPPLRYRVKDILPLIKHFVDKYSNRFKLNKTFDKSAIDYMESYSWPGNIRELENVIQRLLISTNSSTINASHVAKTLQLSNMDMGQSTAPSWSTSTTLEEMLEAQEYHILKDAKERYKTTRKMADALGLSQSTLVRKLHKYSL